MGQTIPIVLQVEQHRDKLSNLNREIGEKQRELQIMNNDLEKNRRELVSALREGEGEIADTQQKMKVSTMCATIHHEVLFTADCGWGIKGS